MSATVRVALLGNVVNCLLPIAQALREGGVEAELFVDEAAPASGRPESADPRLAQASWIHRGPWFSRRSLLRPSRSPVVARLGDYDLVVVSGPGPVYAQFSGRPWCWLVSGADLTVTPFPWAFRSAFSGRVRRIGAYPLAHWQRRAAPRAKEIWVQPFAPMRDAIARLGLASPPVSNRYMPMVVDVDQMQRGDGRPVVPAAMQPIVDRMEAAALVVFHPTRLVMSASAVSRRAGQDKGNDQLLRALRVLQDRGEVARVLVVIPAIDGSRDLTAARALVEELEIEQLVLWAVPPAPGGFDRAEMRLLYDHSDVVADEFAAGWFGLVTLEALAMEVPVVSHLDERAMRVLYPEGHPVQTAETPAEIADRLVSLRNPEHRRAIGRAGRAWVVQHHSPAAAKAHYLDAVTRAAVG